MYSVKRPAAVRDMTTGDPVRLILLFAIPLFIGNIFQQFYNMVDTMVVGHHLGDQAIAAIGATSSLYSLIVNFAGGLNSGYSIIVTQCFGSHDRQKMKQAIAGMIELDLIISILLSVLALLCLPWLMVFMNTPEAVFQQSYTYIAIICGGMTATICYNMFAAILRAMGNSRSPLYFLILSSLLNVVLDLLFVMVLEIGIAGAAIATVISQCVSAVSCGIYTLHNYRDYLPEKGDFRVPGWMLKNLLATGLASAMMSCMVDLGNVIYQRANNLLGERIITAYAAGRKILMIMLQPLATLAFASSTFAGQNWGAGKYDRIRTTLKKVLLMEVGWGIFAAGIVYLFGEKLIRLIIGTSDAEILRNAVMSLRIHFSMLPMLGILFCMRHTMQGMGMKLAPVLSSCIELAMKLLAAAVLIPRLGFLGTCITEPVSWCLMSAFLLCSYFRKRKLLFSAG